MPLNWIDVRDYPFSSLLFLERFQIRYLMAGSGEDWEAQMGIALRGNPAVAWYLARRCPEAADRVARLAQSAPEGDVRQAELRVLAGVEDFVTYTTPDIMDAVSDYIYAWDEARLWELADFSGRRVLDVGSGSGRLTFAAAKRAAEVYAAEPVGMLREYLRDRIARDGIGNVRVTEGFADALPYPDDTFDIVMSGHVVGDDFERELAELTRVVRSDGWILDCPGEDPRRKPPIQGYREHGFEEMYYRSKLGGDVYRYRKQIIK